jgi:tight adherence protein C
LVICTEAGLALDLAISRVTREIQRSSPALAEEFFLLTLEVRAGGSREGALRSLALRANVDEVSSLVSVLIQADRFGTSIGDALRVQSEVSRVRRMQRAEEMASKIPVKMLIPLILLIFPALMIVLLGPAVLQITRAFAD